MNLYSNTLYGSIGALACGIAGFCTGGPSGAYTGASIGYKSVTTALGISNKGIVDRVGDTTCEISKKITDTGCDIANHVATGTGSVVNRVLDIGDKTLTQVIDRVDTQVSFGLRMTNFYMNKFANLGICLGMVNYMYPTVSSILEKRCSANYSSICELAKYSDSFLLYSIALNVAYIGYKGVAHMNSTSVRVEYTSTPLKKINPLFESAKPDVVEKATQTTTTSPSELDSAPSVESTARTPEAPRQVQEQNIPRPAATAPLNNGRCLTRNQVAHVDGALTASATVVTTLLFTSTPVGWAAAGIGYAGYGLGYYSYHGIARLFGK